MARRKQLKGIAGNLAQWCLSRNFDHEGYWAVGQFYADAEERKSKEFVIHLINDFITNDAIGVKFSKAIRALLVILKKDIEANKIPDSWVKNVDIIFKFNSDYQHKHHYWGSMLGGKPCLCIVNITTDKDRTYSKVLGCNVWIHNPNREQRRYGF